MPMSETAEAVKMSAEVLGRDHGLSAQEMNWVLKLGGVLDGEPGAWGLTEKGARYAAERLDWLFDNSWVKRTWGPAVLGELDLSEAGKRRAREAAADWRRAKKLAREAAASAPLVLPVAAENAAAAARTVDPETLAKVLLPVLAAGAVGYGLYKTVPSVRRRSQERAGASEQARDRDARGPQPEA